MSQGAQLCSQCRAPLPAETGLVACSFCGAVTRVDAPAGTAQIRAVVKRVLAEDSDRPASPATAQGQQKRAAVMIAMVVVLMMGVSASALVLWSTSSTSARVAPVVRSTVTPVQPVVVPKGDPLAGRAASGLGVPDSIAFGEGSALYLVSGGALVKADRSTLRAQWRTQLFDPTVPAMRARPWAVGSIVALAGKVAFAGPLGISFLDAATGAPTGKFLFRHDGFKVSACAAGAHEVLVKTVFDGTLRFDLRTGAKGLGTAGCEVMDTLHCDVGQRCGWSHGRVGEMECRYVLNRGSHQVTFCEADGTKELVLVDHDGAHVRWKTPRGQGSTTNPSYASVVEGLLITGDHGHLEAFDEAHGERKWSRAYEGDEGAVLSDGRHLFIGAEGTVLMVDAKTGAEAGRFREAD